MVLLIRGFFWTPVEMAVLDPCEAKPRSAPQNSFAINARPSLLIAPGIITQSYPLVASPPPSPVLP